MIAEKLRETLGQRADYTFKFNVQTGRHGWLRLTPAYSVKIVEQLIVAHPEAKRILDPFCGTGTTALSAAYHGHQSITTDINPFLIWVAKAKTTHFGRQDIADAHSGCKEALDLVRHQSTEPAPCPPIHKIERWWAREALEFLRFLKGAIKKVSRPTSKAETLLMIAFCRSLISLSNAAFNHQSMSFKDDGQLDIGLDVDMPSLFQRDVTFVLDGAAENPPGSADVLLRDARDLGSLPGRRVDLVVTSPPYANRMSYIRELRPYMYWLDFLVNGRDAGEVDWTAIGGTWGVATSRLMDWQRDRDHFKNAALSRIVDQIAHADNKSGVVLSNYVAKYFDDMWQHFESLTKVLARGAELHYIVGNSTFYGVVLPTERLYADMLSSLGFAKVACEPIRKRNSKKELIEFDVKATWQ